MVNKRNNIQVAKDEYSFLLNNLIGKDIGLLRCDASGIKLYYNFRLYNDSNRFENIVLIEFDTVAYYPWYKDNKLKFDKDCKLWQYAFIKHDKIDGTIKFNEWEYKVLEGISIDDEKAEEIVRGYIKENTSYGKEH